MPAVEPDTQTTEFIRVAEEAARAAGAVALDGFRGVMEVRSKGGKDIVTQYDTAAEEAALGVLRRNFPDHAILAEESGLSTQTTGDKQDRESGIGNRDSNVSTFQRSNVPTFLWAVDPIDGTHNYAMQLPFWCTSVAVAEAQTGSVIAGVVFDVLHGELFSATRGGGSYLNGKPMYVSDKAACAQAILACDIGYQPEVAHRMLALAGWMQPRVQRLRLMGSAVLALAYVAAGRFDAYYHLSLQPWDIAAASLLVSEAGGTITDWEGKPIRAVKTGAVAANPTLQPEVLALLREGEFSEHEV